MYTPFLKPTRMKHLDGDYRCKTTGGICKFDKFILKGFIDCDTEKPYDAYWVKYTGSDGNYYGRCILTPETLESGYEKLNHASNKEGL